MFKYFNTILISLLLPWHSLFAQEDNFGLEDVDTALGSNELTDIIVNIINIFLGLLGILAVSLILYGGFLWMTSQGNSDQVTKAKQLIISAIIGLVIILSSYAIASYIIGSLSEATGITESDINTSTTDSPGSGDPDGGLGCPEPLDEDEIKICSISPSNGSSGSYVTIRGWNFGEIEGSVTFDNNAGNTTSADLVSCNGNVLWTDTEIKVVVPNINEATYSVYVNNIDYTSFVVSEGASGPNIACLTPDLGPGGESVVISGIGFGVQGGNVTMNGWVNNLEEEIILNSTSWSENEISISINNNALSSDISINTVEELSSSGEYFTVSCQSGEECSSGCCDNNSCYSIDICMENDPEGIYISNIYPPDGAGGSLVTITGSGFGETAGIVTFYDQDSGEPANFPSTINNNCSDYWTNNTIVVEVPPDLNNELLDIRVNINSQESNSGSFEKNEVIRPGICGLSADSGVFEDIITFYGLNFSENDQVLFGGDDWAVDINYTDSQTVTASIPNMSSQNLDVFISSNNINSNSYPFTIASTEGGKPFITSIIPEDFANTLEYITIYGGNFGNSGLVYVIDSNGTEHPFDIDLIPTQCNSNFWQDDQIIVAFSDQGSKIKIVRNDDIASDEYNYNIQGGSAAPSIACIIPDNGPVNSLVNIYGNSFIGDSRIIFTDNVEADLGASIINSQQILNIPVPEDSETGNVYYTNDINSNALLFEVGSCSGDSDCDNQLCCSGDFGNYCADSCEIEPNQCEASWTITSASEEFSLVESYECSNNTQSPAPWPHGLEEYSSEDAYLDTNISIRFTREIEVDDLLNIDNLKLYSCEDYNSNCNTLINGEYLSIDNNKGVSFNPQSNLNPSTWYQVVLGSFNSKIGNDTLELSNYPWHFKTAGGLCQIDSISLSPDSSPNRDIYLGNEKTYTAIPQSANCNICGSDYNWSSVLLGSDDYISTIASSNNPSNIFWTKLRGDIISDPGYTSLGVNVEDYAASTDIMVLAPNLELMDYGPQCDDSCNNPEVWAEFNTNIAVSSDLQLYSCNSVGDCSGDSLVSSWDITDNIIKITNLNIPLGLYKAVLGENIENEYGYSLGYEHNWYFTVGNQNCEFSSIDIKPDNYLSGELNEIIEYEAMPYSDTGVCNGQPLNCENCSWSWSLDNTLANLSSGSGPEATITTLAEGEVNISASIIDNNVVAGQDSLTISLGTDGDDEEYPPNNQAPVILNDNPDESNTCLNASIFVTFSELMNEQSLRDNMHVYKLADSNYTEISGSFIFAKDNYNGDDDNETRVIFNPDEYLEAGGVYKGLIGENVVSSAGLLLSYINHNEDLEPGHLWTFSGGEDLCQISYIDIDPEELIFTIPNSLESFTAQAYDISGIALNVDTYNWSLIDTNLFSLENNNSQTANLSSLNNNGETYLNVQVSDSDPAIGQGSSLARVEAFLCENPWPSNNGEFNIFSDNDYGNNDFNFSMYYCQNEGLEGSELLPYLPDSNFIMQEGGDVLKEYVFVINPALTMINNNFVYNRNDNRSWWQKIFNWRIIKAQSFAVYNFMITENDGNQISLQWQDDTETYANSFNLERRTAGASWTEVSGNLSDLAPNLFGYTDQDILTGISYEYRVGLGGNYTDPITVTAGEDDPSFDIIGLRIISNMDHLSARDWFRQQAPNANATGQLIEVAGYEALRVGNTIYIAGTNFNDTSLYTNIYALSYNIGARPSTINIYNQLIANFELNTNLPTIGNSNTCFEESTLECFDDYDCGVGDYCLSTGSKLHRDTKRLSDLISIKDSLDNYGSQNKFCSTNMAPCFNDSNCLGDSNYCQEYYPSLNSGTFVNGMTTTKWGSWNEELGNTIGESLPVDPVNKFNGCPYGIDDSTCWDEGAQNFICPQNSLIYLYQQNDLTSYSIGANFESGSSFTNALNGNNGIGVNSILNIIDLDNVCNADTYNAAGLPSTQVCGDGIVNELEECDGNPANICPENYWEAYTVGCYPAGSLNSVGDLIECTWYITPDNYDCGGYCGDAEVYDLYEDCEVGVNEADFNCLDDNNNYYSPLCQSCFPVCDDGSAAASCNDGYWDPNNEQCDDSGSPTGLNNWDCTNGDNISCNNCQVTCSGSGISYYGQCGNTATEGPEECDYSGYGPISTALANSVNTQYACSYICEDTGGYCGDSEEQTSYGEECDPSNYTVPTPINSNPNIQYECSNICADAGGYCDDGSIQTSYGEECDTASYAYPSPSEAIDSNTQYNCTANCKIDGGYCGDGVEQANYNEECDPSGYTAPSPINSNLSTQYSCSNTCADTGGYCGNNSIESSEICESTLHSQPTPGQSGIEWEYECDADSCQYTGGYCGDSNIQENYGEQCDFNSYVSPTPQNSSNIDQYSCDNNCQIFGGYCGDGNIDSYYEDCEIGMSCKDYDSAYLAGQVTCGDPGTSNACQVTETASCCSSDKLQAKFLVDNSFELWVNGSSIGTGDHWGGCDGGGVGDACEFEIDAADGFSFDNSENILAFKAHDTSGGYGVIGTFSCQEHTCKSICYKGSDAGEICSSDANCSEGTCVHPAAGKEGQVCTENNDCRTYTLDSGEEATGSTNSKPSLCLPDDFGITTRPDGLWKCVHGSDPGDGWKEAEYTESSDWQAPIEEWFSGAWGLSSHPSYWKHMVPGAVSIWDARVESGSDIYCRYVLVTGADL